MTPYSKNGLHEYYFNTYRNMIKHTEVLSSSREICQKPGNINGYAGECLIYYLILDKILSLFDIGEIKSIELRGDITTGINENGDIGGDVVVFTVDNRVWILEIKCFTSQNGYTNKSVRNEEADFWVLCDFREFRKGNNIVKISVIKNFYKYSTTISIFANGEKKLKLKDVIETAQKIGDNDYLKVKDVDLDNYLTAKENPKDHAHTNGFWYW